MTEAIYSKYNIDPNKLSRDYLKNPLYIAKNGIGSERPTREDLIYLYIEHNLSYTELKVMFGWTINCLKRWIRVYDITKSYNLRIKNIEKTCLEKYGVISPNKLDWKKQKSNQTCLKKYGVDNYSKTKLKKDMYNNEEWVQRFKHKEYLTKKRNNSFNKSKPEDDYYELLCKRYEKANVIRQYRTELYPFNCDFYIPSKELYIEYQGNWTHGPEPYDPSNKEHQLLLEKWKSKTNWEDYYSYAIKYWTITDPLKRETAQKNNLNLIEIWS